jgi:hypothetical protein
MAVPTTRTRFRIPPADSLLRSYHVDDVLTDHVSSILETIAEEIQQAQDRKAQKASLELPTTFELHPMTREQGQQYVYYYVIRSLREEGYIPQMHFLGRGAQQQVTITVTWKSKDQARMESEMAAYIRSHSDTQPEESAIPHATPVRRRRRAAP